MDNNYIDVPLYTTLNEIKNKNFSLSATQYKKFCIKNNNIVPVSFFLDRKLNHNDLGSEVGSNAYVENSPFVFIKTKALQPESYLLDITKESIQNITPSAFVNSNLKKGDLLISKDSNVGEIVILDKDYENAMLSSAIYKLPVSKHKYYLLAFMKSELFRQQIDFMVPRGSTIRHGKTKFLDCMIPLPNYDSERTIEFVEKLTMAIINKEILIQKRYDKIISLISNELLTNQKEEQFLFNLPSIKEIMELDRMDSSLYSKRFKQNEFLITNYKNGFKTIKQLGFSPSRGQNLQISNIGKSIHTFEKKQDYYTLILPKYLSKYGTVLTKEYLGNPNFLKTLNKGEIIFGAEGNEKGRSLVIIEEQEKTITNIHGITLTQENHDINKGIFVKLFLDYYRYKGMIDDYAVGGNGGSLAIKYWNYLKFPNFPSKIEEEIVNQYYNKNKNYDLSNIEIEEFEKYEKAFNLDAGIYDLDMSLKYLQALLDKILNKIANDEKISFSFVL